MLSFKEYISEVAILAKGQSAERHAKQYVTPYLPGGSKHGAGTHEVASSVGHLNPGDKVTLHGHSVENGVHHVTVSGGNSNNKIKIPVNKLHKPTTRKNRGLAQEGAIAAKLSKSGLMEGGGAGFTGGNDFHLIDKRKKTPKKIRGTEGHTVSQVTGEHKSDIATTAFGQLTVSRHPKTGKWHISDEARARRPEYASHIEKAKVTGPDGKKRSIIDHLNHTEPMGTSNKSGFNSDRTDLSPAHGYMRDHHVHVLHVDSHGTFRAGASEKEDHHKLGLPSMEGEGSFRVRQKTDNPNMRTVQFSIKKLNKSGIHLGKDEDIDKMKKILGHR
jgi:hypothetical protein